MRLAHTPFKRYELAHMKTLTMEEWDAILADEAELREAKEFSYALFAKPGCEPVVRIAESDDDLRVFLGG